VPPLSDRRINLSQQTGEGEGTRGYGIHCRAP
jgi:hypothetical protein